MNDAELQDASGNQTVQTVLRLRDLVLRGELAAGERIAELALVERLGVSRTPIRAALLRLEQEGLIEPLNDRGYRVRAFSQHDIEDAIEVRGALEGLCARLAAERGATADALDAARAALVDIDLALDAPDFGADDFGRYVRANERFHDRLSALAGSTVARGQLERATRLPFASPNAFMRVQAALPDARRTLIVAQDQHHQVLDAIARREGARAEALMREHARLARRLLLQALAHQPTMQLVPGARLIRNTPPLNA